MYISDLEHCSELNGYRISLEFLPSLSPVSYLRTSSVLYYWSEWRHNPAFYRDRNLGVISCSHMTAVLMLLSKYFSNLSIFFIPTATILVQKTTITYKSSLAGPCLQTRVTPRSASLVSLTLPHHHHGCSQNDNFKMQTWLYQSQDISLKLSQCC